MPRTKRVAHTNRSPPVPAAKCTESRRRCRTSKCRCRGHVRGCGRVEHTLQVGTSPPLVVPSSPSSPSQRQLVMCASVPWPSPTCADALARAHAVTLAMSSLCDRTRTPSSTSPPPHADASPLTLSCARPHYVSPLHPVCALRRSRAFIYDDNGAWRWFVWAIGNRLHIPEKHLDDMPNADHPRHERLHPETQAYPAETTT